MYNKREWQIKRPHERIVSSKNYNLLCTFKAIAADKQKNKLQERKRHLFQMATPTPRQHSFIFLPVNLSDNVFAMSNFRDHPIERNDRMQGYGDGVIRPCCCCTDQINTPLLTAMPDILSLLLLLSVQTKITWARVWTTMTILIVYDRVKLLFLLRFWIDKTTTDS